MYFILMNSNRFSLLAWLESFRLRTLPLAFTSIFTGSFLAFPGGCFSGAILGFSLLTTLFLQILSNLANDYGDSVHGADHAGRQGPQRAVQAGKIQPTDMKKAIVLFSAFSFLSGIVLLWVSLANQPSLFVLFLLLGISAILAAILYTNGPKPYGYVGLGDLSVLVFFGIIGVGGSYFLHCQQIEWVILLPALGTGLLATGVLNINNIRDIESDKQAGKVSVPVRLGPRWAKLYHTLLLTGSVLCFSAFQLVSPFAKPWSWLFLLAVPLLLKNGLSIRKGQKATDFDPFLKQLALTSLLLSLLFGVGLMVA